MLLAAIAAAALVGVPGAQPAAEEAVAHHCAPFGEDLGDEVCYAVNRKRTTRTHAFILFMGGPHFSRYRVCVRPPGDEETCRAARVRQMGVFSPRWGGHVSWEGNYPKRGPGPYRVTWSQAGRSLGPPLTFYARLPSYCSESGDVCYGISHAGGAWSFKLTLDSKYFPSYGICVRPAGKAKKCKWFAVKQTGANWGGKVYWSQHFPRAPGRYRVTWRQGASRLGPPLDFTLPVSG